MQIELVYFLLAAVPADEDHHGYLYVNIAARHSDKWKKRRADTILLAFICFKRISKSLIAVSIVFTFTVELQATFISFVSRYRLNYSSNFTFYLIC